MLAHGDTVEGYNRGGKVICRAVDMKTLVMKSSSLGASPCHYTLFHSCPEFKLFSDIRRVHVQRIT